MKDSRIEEIFNAALQKGSAVERVAYLDGACGNNADLRGRVDTLLRAHDEADRFLEPTSAEQQQAERPGSTIGRYKLLQEIGEGGFGIVYMAEQIEPVRRMVAIKIIKLGMDTKQVVARFESEQQALALMDHPNIARVLDAGATDSGRPYFVMELVKGIPITEYCDQNNLSPRERLELFISVCQAVLHAHQKGIIHRDLKPTNVLVTLHDGRPVPKVIDFGIAKATNQRLTEKTLFTEFRQFIGTPQYMSPEQAEMSGLDVDTRSDIYSLGVLLYELLTGTTPFDAETLRAAGYAEIQRIIRQEEPTRPWVRVSTMREPLATIAKHRSVDPDSLSKLIRGDLDSIVMKSLEKDRTRRYQTASNLAEDIQRHLRNEPVHARPPSAAYKLRKFVRRNKVGVTAAGLVAAALLVGITLATAGLLQARSERGRAIDALGAARRQADRANQEAARSQAIADFLQEILASVDPEEAAKRSVDVERVVARARELFGDEHATVAAALASLALQLQQAGDFAAAEPLYRESVRIARRVYGDKHANVGLTLGRLGSLLRLQGDDAGAEHALREAIQSTNELTGKPALATCDARMELAEILKRRAKFDEAESLVRESLEIRRANPQGQDFQIAHTLEQLHAVLTLAGKDDDAERVLHELVEAYKGIFPAESLTAAWIHLGSGLWLQQRGRTERAEPYFREAVRVYRLNPNPPREMYLLAVNGLFQILRKREADFDETMALFQEAIENMQFVYGRDHLLIAPHLLGFAQELENRERAAEAIPLIVDGIRINRKAKGDDWDATSSLEMLERFVRRVVLAPGLPPDRYRTAASGAEALVTEKPNDASCRVLLGMVQFRLGQLQDARKNLASASGTDSEQPPEHRPQPLAFLAMTQFRSGEVDKARTTLDKLRTLMADESIAKSKDNRTVFGEAEALMTTKPSNE